MRNVTKLPLLLVGLALLVGLLATLAWFTGTPVAAPFRRPGVLVPVLLLTAALTTVNLLLRWLRWHFLTRRFRGRLRTRESLQLWFATLPAILTPFYLGELVRGVVLARQSPRAHALTFWVWFVERGLDVAVVTLLLLAVTGRWVVFGLGLVVVLVFAGVVSRKTEEDPSPVMTAVVLVPLTVVVWLLPPIALWGGLHLLGAPVSPAAAGQAFSLGTLLGGLTGLPLGAGVTGSAGIAVLLSSGVPESAAVVAMALFRTGTAWFAVLLGLGLAVHWRAALARLWHGADPQDHFDDIAADYEAQIPEHVRMRLLRRKVTMMVDDLAPAAAASAAPLRGLDLGCGQGWYTVEMAEAGFHMVGLDVSAGQIDHARQYARSRGLDVDFICQSATTLPFEDASFDFAYAINVLHHIEDRRAQRQVFAELVRVLRPGGVFFLQEMNVENPLFRFYMGYLFPVLRDIDEGTEMWLRPTALPAAAGASWDAEVSYFTFLPEFVPPFLLRWLAGVEAWLERSRFSRYSAHYLARLVRALDATDEDATGRPHRTTSEH